jgi:hypothetical protein
MERDKSSLDRFLQQRAQHLITGAFGLNSLVFQQLIGAICTVAAVGIGIASFVTRQPELLAGASGPLIAGGVNLVVPSIIRRRLGQRASTDATMTPEARSFLISLLRKASGWGIGWPEGHPMSRLYERRMMRRIALGTAFGLAPRSVKDVLDARLFEILDGACYEYNRVLGIIETGHGNPTILKMSRQIQLAADEALFDVFHQAATVSQYPESTSSVEQRCESRTNALRELGDRLENLQTREQTLTERIAYSSTMDTVLEELRMDDLARTELNKPAEDIQQRLNQGG